MATTKRKSKRTIITETRREYNKLNRTYKAAGRKAAGKPARSGARREYAAAKRERNLVGRRLGKLTGVHSGR